MAELGVICNPSELDRLIHSYQCENEQLLKLIDIEKQYNEAIEKEIQSKIEDIKQLELSNSKLDEETRRAHKQFTINRDNCESLKKTLVVLKEHEEALIKKLEADKLVNENERLEREQILKHYMNIWNNYEAKYESFPLAMQLRQREAEMEDLKKKVTEMENKRNVLQTQIEQAKVEKERGDFRKFCIKIAKVKVSTENKKREIDKMLKEKSKVEEEIRETQERKQKEKEKRELEDRENEAMDCSNIEESHTAHHQDQSRTAHHQDQSRTAHHQDQSRTAHHQDQYNTAHHKDQYNTAHHQDQSPTAHHQDQSRTAHHQDQSRTAHHQDQSHTAHHQDQSRTAHHQDQSCSAHHQDQSRTAHHQDQSSSAHHQDQSSSAHHKDPCTDHNNNMLENTEDEESMMISIYSDKDSMNNVQDNEENRGESLTKLGSSSQILHPLITSQSPQTTKTSSGQPQNQGYFRAPDSSHAPLSVPTFRTPHMPTVPPLQRQINRIQTLSTRQQNIPSPPVLYRMPSITRPQLSQQQARRISLPQYQMSPRPAQVMAVPQVTQSPTPQQVRLSLSEAPRPKSAPSPVAKQTSTLIEMQRIPVPFSPRVQNRAEPATQSPRMHCGMESMPVVKCPRMPNRVESMSVSQSPKVLGRVESNMPVLQSPRVPSRKGSDTVPVSQSPRVQERKQQTQMASQSPETESPIAPNSQADVDTVERNTCIANICKTPEVTRKNTEPGTPENQRMECDSSQSSPFDFEKHKKRLQELRKSPGITDMRFEGRPMFDSDKVSDAENSVDEAAGSFMFSSSFFKSPVIKSNPNNVESSPTNQQNVINTQSPEQAQAAAACISSPKEFNFTTEPSGKFSFGNDTSQNGGTSLMSLFGGNKDSPDLGRNAQEPSFSLNFSNSTSSAEILSPVIPSSFGNSTPSNLLSLFGSPSTSQDSPGTSDNFTLNFAASSMGKDQFPGFSSSAFGGSGDSGMGGSSLLSLFGSPQGEQADGEGDDNFTLQFGGGGDNFNSNKPFKLF